MNIAPLIPLDKIFDFIKEIWHDFKPIVFINEYQRAVLLRAGSYIKSFNKGWYFKIPFIDTILIDICTIDTMVTKSVHITTIDDKTITAVPVVEYEIVDIKKFMIDTNDARTNMHDIVRAAISDYLTDCTWEECKLKRTINHITRKVKEQCEPMGICVSRVMLTDMCVSRVIITQI